MNGRTPLRVIKDSGIIGAERLLDFPVLIMEKNINDLRACTQTVELAAEKDRYFKKFGSYKMDQKTFCDLKTRLNFLDQSAQNVLTYYPPEKDSRRKSIGTLTKHTYILNNIPKFRKQLFY